MKRNPIFRYVAYLLVCVTLLSVFAAPVSALPTEDPLLNTDPIPAPQEATNSYRVSKVHRYGYYSSAEIGSFKDGTKLSVLGVYGDFYKVDCFDMVGYIAKSQVSVDENGEYYVNCNKESSETKYLPYYSMQRALELRHDILDVAKQYLGVRYVSGGTSPRGFDCSGYTQYVYDLMGISLKRTVQDQLTNGVIVAKEDLQCGDLIIFSYTGDYGGFASHVGIYIGNDLVIHASNYGIAISDLNTPYYVNHYQCARRVILEEETFTLSIPVTGIMQNASGSYWRNEASTDSIFVGI